MSESEITKLDIIVKVLNKREPEMRRLVTLDDRIRAFAEPGDGNSQRIPIELIAEWTMLLDKYYPLVLGKRDPLD